MELDSIFFDIRVSGDCSVGNRWNELLSIVVHPRVRSLLECYFTLIEEKTVDQLKWIRLVKSEGEELGLTICQSSWKKDEIVLRRILCGSIDEDFFLLGDEIVQINEMSLRSSSIVFNLDDFLRWIDCLRGEVSFLVRRSVPRLNLINVDVYSLSILRKRLISLVVIWPNVFIVVTFFRLSIRVIVLGGKPCHCRRMNVR